MKKISLKNLNFGGIEKLSREELKNVLGGAAAATRTGKLCQHRCNSHSNCFGECNICTNLNGGSGHGWCMSWS